jgi:phage host-nuclease inhibitor protein Gam
MTRQKTPALDAPQDLTGVEKEMAMYAQDQSELTKVQAEMDAQMAQIRAENAAYLQELTDRMAKSYKRVQAYFETNRGLFGKKKSYEMTQGTVGFRTGTPKCTPSKGFTWAAILKLLKLKNQEYVKTKEEVAKDLLIANREKPEVKVLCLEVGIDIVQDETFFIDLKREEVDAMLN